MCFSSTMRADTWPWASTVATFTAPGSGSPLRRASSIRLRRVARISRFNIRIKTCAERVLARHEFVPRQWRSETRLRRVKPTLCGFQAISVLINGGQSPAVFARQLQLLAQAADMRIHRARADAGPEIPDILQQRIATDNAALAADQVAGQLVFALGQIDFGAGHADATALVIHRVRRQ